VSKLSDRQWEFLKNVAKLIILAEKLEVKLTGGELYRTEYQQKKYVQDNLSETMLSKHLDRLAIDFNFFIDGEIQWGFHPKIQELGNYWENLNPKNEWGGNWKNFKDYPHFQG